MIVQIPRINRGSTVPADGWHRETAWIADYPAGLNDVIAVIGAYSGTTTRLLIERAPEATFHLFEPQDWAIKQLRERFPLPNVHIHPFGLGDRTGRFQMALYTSNGCTFMKGGRQFKEGGDGWFTADQMEFTAAMQSIGIGQIHHASINIEAFEYVLIPYMARTGWLARCKTLGVSWHDTSFNTVLPGPYTWQGEPVPTWAEVQALLAETHDVQLEIDNWQTWVRRES